MLKRVSGDEYPNVISEDDLKDFLGVPIYQRDKYEGNDFAGVVTGLAWTSVGGEILFIESSLSKGKGEKVTLTGNLGDVMKESAIIALQYVKAHADILGIDPEMFEQYQLHVHVPEGAIPKDGPFCRHNYGHFNNFGIYTPESPSPFGHDRRDNIARESPSCRWYKRKDTCRQAGRNYRYCTVIG